MEMAIALPIMLCLLIAAVDLSRAAIAQSLFQSAAIAEVNVIRSYPAADIQNMTAAQVQSSLLDRLSTNAYVWIDPETINVWFDDGVNLLGQRIYFTHHVTSYSPFRKILIWRQSYEKPLALYLQRGP